MAYALHLRKSRADIEAEMRGEGESLARHRRRLLELAARLGLHVACEYRELVSGDKLSDRPEMRRLLSDVAAGRYEGVLTVEVSRLTRGDLSDQGLIVNTFKYSGTKIVTPEHTYDLREDWDEDVIAGDLMLARREYRFIKRRLQRGRNASAAEGLWQGPAPFGYRRVKLPRQKGWTLEPEPCEAALARMAFELYASGREGGAAIARRLNALGSRTSRGNPWTADAVACLVSNPVYAGKVRWNARVSVTRMEGCGLRVRREKNPAPLVSDGRHPPLVPQALFEAAQRVRAERALPRRHADAPLQNPLAGLVFCAACGRAMTRRAHGERAFLRCPRPGCRTRSAPLDRVEAAAVAALSRFALSVDTDDADADGAPLGSPSAADAAQASVARLRAQLERIFAAFEDGAYTAEEFARRREEKRRAIERAEAALRELRQTAPAPGEPPPLSDAAGAYALAATPEQKNRLLKAAFVRIEYQRDDADSEATLTFFPWLPVG